MRIVSTSFGSSELVRKKEGPPVSERTFASAGRDFDVGAGERGHDCVELIEINNNACTIF